MNIALGLLTMIAVTILEIPTFELEDVAKQLDLFQG